MKPGNSKKPKKAAKNGNGRAKAKKIPAVPSILLEGDTTPAPAASGPGRRYATPPTSPAAAAPPPAAQLPDAYGTRKLLLTARDPHWLYAHWDLTGEQLKDYNKKSMDGHLVLRIY